MIIDATEADLHAAAEVLKFAAILDDRAPRADKARIAAWAEKIHKHNLPREDLLDGLQTFYDSPSDRAIGIGDLVWHGRIAKRARLDKEADEEREARQDALSVKAADEMRAFADGVVMGPVKNRTPRIEAAERGLQTCVDKQTAIDAMREFFAAKREAHSTATARTVEGKIAAARRSLEIEQAEK
jgi:hypothetical protein